MMELTTAEYNQLHDRYYDLLMRGDLRAIARREGTYDFEWPDGSLTERINRWRDDIWSVQHGVISPQDYIERADLLMREIIAALEELVWNIDERERGE